MTTPTPTTRRAFLTRLAAAAGLAPLAANALAQPEPYDVDEELASINRILGLPDKRPAVAQGVGIKVPSNRITLPIYRGCHHPILERVHHLYNGDWDGTFKLEHGCTNPAYVLADLYESTDAEPDWVMAFGPNGQVVQTIVSEGSSSLFKPCINWQMLYDWGKWADEQSEDWTCISDKGWHTEHSSGASTRTRFEVHAVDLEPHDVAQLREILRMHYLCWQSTDPRYRTSWPGIPYPGDTEVHA